MTTLKVYEATKDCVTVHIDSDRFSNPDCTLVAKFTDEGLILDLVNREGICIKSFANMYDELEELLK